jgi:hypothetical protein
MEAGNYDAYEDRVSCAVHCWYSVLSTGADATSPSVVATIPVHDLQNIAVNVDKSYLRDSRGASALSVIDGSTNQVVDEVTQLPPSPSLNTHRRIYASFSGDRTGYTSSHRCRNQQILATVQTDTATST